MERKGINLFLRKVVCFMEGLVTETVILETTAVFSEDQKKRYELTKEFKPFKDGKSIVVIMLNSASFKIQQTDTTVNNLINNLSIDLGYSKITILNLIPDIMTKLIPSKIDNLETNFEYIQEVLKRGYDNILIGYGNSYIGNKVVETAKYRLNLLLKEYENTLVEIRDEFNAFDCTAMHPLFAALRIDRWILKPYKLTKQELPPIQTENALDLRKLTKMGHKKGKKDNGRDDNVGQKNRKELS